MLDGRKVVVVMPTYYAAQTLERTVAEIPKLVYEVILVDDGSSDQVVMVHPDYQYTPKLIPALAR